MLPYWRRDTGIGGSADGETVAVTGYLKGKEKLMLVVFNNQDDSVPVRITLDTEKLFGRAGNIEVRDLEGPADLYRGNPEFSVPVSKRGFMLLEAKLIQ